MAFAGPGYLVAVGYMDPGNWATDIAGGSAFGYALLSVILLSNLMAIVLQALAVRLGVASGLDLAQACRAHYSRPVAIALWILCEIAIVACDLAEVLGTNTGATSYHLRQLRALTLDGAEWRKATETTEAKLRRLTDGMKSIKRGLKIYEKDKEVGKFAQKVTEWFEDLESNVDYPQVHDAEPTP